MSAFTQPLVLSAEGSSKLLNRIPLGQGTKGAFSESWLQKALFKHPECLPIREINPHVGELIPICLEIETGAGPADILYVTRTGQIVLVETKLWRNPEARREVVAQILDYAKQLTTWRYEDLAREAASATGKGPEYLRNRVRECAQDIDEALFVDGINRSLKAGDFLLLIVGDGIRSGAEALVGFLEQYGNLRFGLGLVEVAAYEIGTGDILLLPRIIAKTQILERTVLLSPLGSIEFEQASAMEDAEAANPSNSEVIEWFQAFWTDFRQALTLDDAEQPAPTNLPKSTNFFLYLPPGRHQVWISAYIAQSAGEAGVYLTAAKAFERSVEFFELLQAQKEDIERGYHEKLTWEIHPITNKIWISTPRISFTDLNDPEQRQRVVKHLADHTNRMVNAFRFRLEALGKKLG